MTRPLEEIILKEFDKKARIFPESVDENDFRVKAILGEIGNPKGKKILDAGCAIGRFSKIFLKRGADLQAFDLSPELAKMAKKNNPRHKNRFRQASVTKIPFSDGAFDFVFSVEVLEHVPDTKKAVAELCRVAKKGGKIIIIDKNALCTRRLMQKKWLELSGKWFYSREFPFKEKWFYPWELKRELGKHCDKSEVKHLGTPSAKPIPQIPFLSRNLFLAWIGTK